MSSDSPTSDSTSSDNTTSDSPAADSPAADSTASLPVPEVCIGAVVVDDGRLLLIERGRGAAVGQWSVPGGRVDPGETLDAAVTREVLEETGLIVRCGGFIGWVERISAEYHFVIMDFYAELQGSDDARAGDDAAAVAWVPFEDLHRYDLVDGLRAFLDQYGVTAPD